MSWLKMVAAMGNSPARASFTGSCRTFSELLRHSSTFTPVSLSKASMIGPKSWVLNKVYKLSRPVLRAPSSRRASRSVRLYM